MNMVMSIDEALKLLPDGYRFNVGHTPHWYMRNEIPKLLKKKPYEAYVLTGTIGTKTWIFESADGSSPGEALKFAIIKAIEKQ